jgi:hypothetical protein
MGRATHWLTVNGRTFTLNSRNVAVFPSINPAADMFVGKKTALPTNELSHFAGLQIIIRRMSALTQIGLTMVAPKPRLCGALLDQSTIARPTKNSKETQLQRALIRYARRIL